MDYTITIVGGGPAGLSAALTLAKAGIYCKIIEKEVFPRDKICGDALSGKVISSLKKIVPSVLNDFMAYPQFNPCYGIRFISPGQHELEIPFKPDYPKVNNESIRPSGFVAKRIDFDYYLFQKCTNNQFIDIIQNSQVVKYEKNSCGILLTLENGLKYTSNLVLACDGSQSIFARKYAGLQFEDSHYCGALRQYYSNVTFENEGFLELYFFKDVLPGYFWIFPLGNGIANIGIGMRKDFIIKKRINLKKMLSSIIQNQNILKNRFLHAQPLESPKGFGLPLGSKKRKIFGDHYLLCGDAAMLIDPFTGEGISNAIASGILAAKTAIRAVEVNDFSSTTLSTYQNELEEKIGKELKISYWLQKLCLYPFLLDAVIKKAAKNQNLRNTLIAMFNDVDLRKEFKNPFFYLNLLK
jgi:geranylgeranyl reductase family protein